MTLKLNRPLSQDRRQPWRTAMLHQLSRRNRNQTQQLSGEYRTPDGTPMAVWNCKI
jgi:hypothetical protein